MPENNPRLAKAVRDWVEQRGLTQPVISARGGPSSTSMTKVLTGRGSFAASMFLKLDRGLGWGDGTAERHWRGEALASSVDWREASDQELVEELSRRLANRGGQQDAGTAEAQKTPPGLRAVPDEGARRTAARGGPERSTYEQIVAEQDEAETAADQEGPEFGA